MHIPETKLPICSFASRKSENVLRTETLPVIRGRFAGASREAAAAGPVGAEMGGVAAYTPE